MMGYRAKRDQDEDEELSQALAAVASPVRLALLRTLRTPHALTEIQLNATSDSAWGVANRPLSRQTVKTHVDRLVEAGAVGVRETTRGGRSTVEYVLNHQALFALSEKFRALALLRPSTAPEQPTLSGQDAVETRHLEGPRLVLIKGVDEGRAWPLAGEAPEGWHIGRGRHANVQLDYDPYVSAEHARVVRDESGYHLVPAPGSVNPVRVNFMPVRDASVRLVDGDTLGVGRSILLFRDRSVRRE